MEKTMYPVCPDRNVGAAFECFLGPDSRRLERFLSDQRMHWAGRTLRIAQVRGRRAFAGAARGLRTGGLVISKAVEDLNLVLVFGWIAASCVLSALAWASRFLLYQAGVAMRLAAPRTALITALVKELCGVRLPRGWRRGNDAAAVIGRWAAHYRLPLKEPLADRLDPAWPS
jgi:hypothetical protein